MKISEREKRLLAVLAAVVLIYLLFGIGAPKVKEINDIKSDIESAKYDIDSKNHELKKLTNEINTTQLEYDKMRNYFIDTATGEDGTKFYTNITNGEIIVEINKFIPVSKTDKFVIDQILFVENEQPQDVTENPDGITEMTEETDPETPTEENSDVEGENQEVPANDSAETKDPTDPEDPVDSFISSLSKFEYLENVAEVSFEGYYDSLVKFVENANNNDRYVEVVAIEIVNSSIVDPTLKEGTIKGKIVLSFPTYEGFDDSMDIYSTLNSQYNTATKDPFNPFDSFVSTEDTVDNGFDGTTVVFKTVENFSKNPYFFVTNDDRNSGYISTSQKSTDGNASLKIYYDFYNRSNKNEVYAVSERENVTIDNTPQEMSIDIFNDSANENQFGVVFRDATGKEIDTLISPNLGFNGWSTEYIPLPENAVYPVVVQRFYVRSGGSGVKQEGTILIDNLQVLEY